MTGSKGVLQKQRQYNIWDQCFGLGCSSLVDWCPLPIFIIGFMVLLCCGYGSHADPATILLQGVMHWEMRSVAKLVVFTVRLHSCGNSAVYFRVGKTPWFPGWSGHSRMCMHDVISCWNVSPSAIIYEWAVGGFLVSSILLYGGVLHPCIASAAGVTFRYIFSTSLENMRNNVDVHLPVHIPVLYIVHALFNSSYI